MAVRDFTSQRVFLDAALTNDARVPCAPATLHYLRDVLRLSGGATVLVFNGRDGEWRAELQFEGKRAAALAILDQVRCQESGPDHWLVFAPLKHARLDYMVQKAVELGVSRLVPVMTQHTIAGRINLDRARANVIEAAEQCGILRLPDFAEPVKLEALLDRWDPARTLVFCDEDAPAVSPLDALAQIPRGALAMLIGPEGGFSATERATIGAKPFTRAISMGPRIMRADTAAVAALSLANAVLGDWR